MIAYGRNQETFPLRMVDHATYPAMATPCCCPRDEQGELFIFCSLCSLLFWSVPVPRCARPGSRACRLRSREPDSEASPVRRDTNDAWDTCRNHGRRRPDTVSGSGGRGESSPSPSLSLASERPHRDVQETISLRYTAAASASLSAAGPRQHRRPRAPSGGSDHDIRPSHHSRQ
jgi:hypothetical protein